jgi:hypothetical protein
MFAALAAPLGVQLRGDPFLAGSRTSSFQMRVDMGSSGAGEQAEQPPHTPRSRSMPTQGVPNWV